MAVVLGPVVAVGQHVQAGDELVLLESMKMEIPVLSPVAGRVVEVAPAGLQVQEGDALAVLEPAPAR